MQALKLALLSALTVLCAAVLIAREVGKSPERSVVHNRLLVQWTARPGASAEGRHFAALEVEVTGLDAHYLRRISGPPRFEATAVLYRDADADGVLGAGDEMLGPARDLRDHALLQPGKRERLRATSAYPYLLSPRRHSFLVTHEGEVVLPPLELHFENATDGSRTDYSERRTDAAFRDQVKLRSSGSLPDFVRRESDGLRIPAGTHRVTADVIVPDSVPRLIIEAGAELLLGPDVSILADTVVKAVGTADRPVRFGRLVETEPWGVLGVASERGAGSSFEHCLFDGGGDEYFAGVYYSGMLSLYHCREVALKDCEFSRACADDALNVKYARATMAGCRFVHNSADAVDFDFVAGEISDCTFLDNGNDGIDLSGSPTRVHRNRIRGSGDKGISIGEGSRPVVYDNAIEGCVIGLEVKDSSLATIVNCVVIDSRLGINLYQKKEHFGGGSATVTNCLFRGNDRDLAFENTFSGSVLATDDSRVRFRHSLVHLPEELRGDPRVDRTGGGGLAAPEDLLSLPGRGDAETLAEILGHPVDSAPIGLLEPQSGRGGR